MVAYRTINVYYTGSQSIRMQCDLTLDTEALFSVIDDSLGWPLLIYSVYVNAI